MSSTQQATGRRGNKNAQQTVAPTPAVPEVVAVAPTNVVSNAVEVAVTGPAPVQKRGKKSEVAQSAPASVPAPVAVPVPVQTTSAVTSHATVAESAPAVHVEGGEHVEGSSTKQFEDLIKEIYELDKKLAELQRNRQTLTKEAVKLHTQQSRQLKKNRHNSARSSKRAMSGFNKPKLVPAAFRAYLGLEANAELPRTEVTKQLYAKIKSLNLLDPSDKRKIVPDQALRTLFHMKPDEQIEFNTFQSFVTRIYSADPETLALKAAELANASASANASTVASATVTA